VVAILVVAFLTIWAKSFWTENPQGKWVLEDGTEVLEVKPGGQILLGHYKMPSTCSEVPWHAFETSDGTWIAVNSDPLSSEQGSVKTGDSALKRAKPLKGAKVFNVEVKSVPLMIFILHGNRIRMDSSNGSVILLRKTWFTSLEAWWNDQSPWRFWP